LVAKSLGQFHANGLDWDSGQGTSFISIGDSLRFMTLVIEREFEREGGLRAHGRAYGPNGSPARYIRSGGEIILHRLSEDILTSNVFGVLEKLEPSLWLKPLLARCFQRDRFLQLFSNENYRRDEIKFLFWHELGRPDRPRGHEEASTQVDLFVVMPKATVSFEVKLGAELSRSITTDLADPKRNRPGVPDPSLWWDQVIRNLERGYVYTVDNYPERSFFLIVLSMDEESPGSPFLSRYKDHSGEIRRQIESGYRWKSAEEMRRYFNDTVYEKLSRQLAWLTWPEVTEILDQTGSQNLVEELFIHEVVEYINRKITIYDEMNVKRVVRRFSSLANQERGGVPHDLV